MRWPWRKPPETTQEFRDPQIGKVADPGPVKDMEAYATFIRMNGRRNGWFYEQTGLFMKERGYEWPRVIQDRATDTATVPATPMGLIALVSSWDSLLSDKEYLMLRAVVEQMVPMGLIGQHRLTELVEEELARHDGEDIYD